MSVLRSSWRSGGVAVMYMTGQIQALADQEQYSHAQAAEDFEVDPDVLEGEGNEQVGCTAEQEKRDPGDVQARPDVFRQADGVAHDALDQHPVTNEVATGKRQGEQPVDYRRLPLEEGFAMERQGQAAEYQAGEQGQPLAFFQLALANEKRAVDHNRADDQHGRGTEDTSDFETVTGKFDGTRIEFEDDEEQEQRDEIDELFHSGSQKQDVTA